MFKFKNRYIYTKSFISFRGNASDEFVKKETDRILEEIEITKKDIILRAGEGNYKLAAKLNNEITKLYERLQKIKEQALNPQLVNQEYKRFVKDVSADLSMPSLIIISLLVITMVLVSIGKMSQLFFVLFKFKYINRFYFLQVCHTQNSKTIFSLNDPKPI